MQMRKARVAARDERAGGFSMPEVVAASGIIIATVAAFTVFMMSMLTQLAESRLNLVATRAAADQIETLNGIRWDDLMVGSGECDLTGTGEARRPTAALKTGPDVIQMDGVNMSVTRNVQWGSVNGPQVVCGNGAGDGLKVVTVNVSYYVGADLRTETMSEARSRFAEAPRQVD